MCCEVRKDFASGNGRHQRPIILLISVFGDTCHDIVYTKKCYDIVYRPLRSVMDDGDPTLPRDGTDLRPLRSVMDDGDRTPYTTEWHGVSTVAR